MAEHHELYQRAYYYDIALKRDVGAEIDFIIAAYEHYAGRPLESVIDIACGPGYHARAFAQHGIRSLGLDLHPEMIRFAADNAADEDLNIEWIATDMRFFKLSSPVDMAICMFDGIDALVENEDLIQHFRAVGENLTAKGLYLIDISHPRVVNYEHYEDFIYRGKQGGIQVEIIWGINNPRPELVTAVSETEIEVRINDHGNKITIHDTAKERIFFPQELILLAMLSGVFEVVGWHGDYDIHQPLDYSLNSRRMIAIMQKR